MTVLEQLDSRAPGCFLCRWIAEDLRTNKAVTNHPKCANIPEGLFPVASKFLHLWVERIAIDIAGKITILLVE
jgi:hypothetical protein